MQVFNELFVPENTPSFIGTVFVVIGVGCCVCIICFVTFFYGKKSGSGSGIESVNYDAIGMNSDNIKIENNDANTNNNNNNDNTNNNNNNSNNTDNKTNNSNNNNITKMPPKKKNKARSRNYIKVPLVLTPSALLLIAPPLEKF